MRFFTLSLLLIAAGCEFGVIQAPLKQPNHSFLSECDRPDLAQASAIVADALCGTLDVLENPENPVGRVIPLNIMLLPATSTVTKPDPIFSSRWARTVRRRRGCLYFLKPRRNPQR